MVSFVTTSETAFSRLTPYELEFSLRVLIAPLAQGMRLWLSFSFSQLNSGTIEFKLETEIKQVNIK